MTLLFQLFQATACPFETFQKQKETEANAVKSNGMVIDIIEMAPLIPICKIAILGDRNLSLPCRTLLVYCGSPCLWIVWDKTTCAVLNVR